ncbi:Putative BRCT domain superfamily protein [Septoria linicola]|uniref:BRCT domain superfamily protein n=1 Tax=Septoria linicola TaxID=215465 RepID=A0A9Q9EED1_9PEZI|nr:Putative BRCT domain superfamily protein [Septoria linicola]
MAQRSLVLRCMYGCLISSPDIETLPLDESLHEFTFTQICCRVGIISLREETEQNRILTDVIGRLKLRAPIIEFETYISDTSIEAPPSAYFARTYEYARLGLPQSTTCHRHCMHLRPGDTIDFCSLNVKLELALPQEDLTRPISAASTVTMSGSPTLTPEKAEVVRPDHETDSEDDDDLDRVQKPSVKPADDDAYDGEGVNKSLSDHNDGDEGVDISLPDQDNGVDISLSDNNDGIDISLPDHDNGGDKSLPDDEAGVVISLPENSPPDNGDTVDVSLSDATERRHETQETEPIVEADATVQQAMPKTVIENSEQEDADLLTSEPLVEVTAIVHKAQAKTKASNNPSRQNVSATQQVVGTTITVQPDASTPAPRGIKRKLQARADPYDVPDDDENDHDARSATGKSSKSRKGCRRLHWTVTLTKTILVRRLNMRGSAKKQKAATVAVPENDAEETEEDEDDEDEIAVAPASVKPRKNLKSLPKTPAKRATSTQSTRSSTPSSSAFSGKTPTILLSKSELVPAAKAWMTRRKFKVAEKTPSKHTNFVCVVRDGPLPSTVKVLKTLLAGKPVVGDSWITASRQEGELQNADEYIHRDLEDIDVEPATRRSLFAGKTLFFTVEAARSYHHEWSDIQDIASAAGAMEIVLGGAGKGSSLRPKDHVLMFGVDDAADDIAEALIENGRTVFNKTVLAQWIIHGDIELDDDSTKLTLPLGGKKGKKGKK